MKSLLLKALYFLQIHRLIRYLWKEKVIILMYHGFTKKEANEGIENYQRKHLYIGRFQSQLGYLKKHHPIISLEELVDAYLHGKKIPPRSVVITIDDGYQSSYRLAFPVLKQLRVPATVFLATDFIDNKTFLWTDRTEYAINQAEPSRFDLKAGSVSDRGFSLAVEFDDQESRVTCEKQIRMKLKTVPQELRPKIIEILEQRVGRKLSLESNSPEIYRALEWFEINEMIHSGLISIGSHSHSHVILTKCDPETVERELRFSKEIIEKRTGSSCRLFCYPNGEVGDFNHETKSCLKELGYTCGLTTVPGVNDKNSDVFELKRRGTPWGGSEAEFVMNLYGITQFFSDLKHFLFRLVGIKHDRTL